MMTHLKKEFLVGCLVILVVVLMGVFAWLMGVLDPFSKGSRFHLLYSFAGGIEVGSPVRLAGVKVGRVDRIEFLKEGEENGEDPVALKVTITVSPDAASSVRKDSKFYVNMAGIIGERYIEVTPGNRTSPLLTDGSEVRGMDPPRIDQLLSQGYGVFGKIQEFLEQNEQTVKDFLDQIHLLLADANKLLKRRDWQKLGELIDNVSEMTGELRFLTKKLKEPGAQEVLDKLNALIDRAHKVDEKVLKQFLQEEGIRARIF